MTTAVRRTQQQRREEAITKLLDATVASLCEKGYASTTVSEIAARAGLSTSGLFRHFPTRLDLIVAAADEVRRCQFEQFREGLARFGTDSVDQCLRLLRTACRAPINGAWYELLIAARSDDELRERLVPFTIRYHEQIRELGGSLPVVQHLEPDNRDAILFTVVYLLDGEALSAVVHPRPEQDELRLHMIARLLQGGTLT